VLVPEDFEIGNGTEVTLGFADPENERLTEFTAEPFKTNSVNSLVIGGQYQGMIEVPENEKGKARLNTKNVKFSNKTVNKPGVTAGTVAFSFSGRGADLAAALKGAKVATLEKSEGQKVATTKTIKTLTLIFRMENNGDVLQYKKKVVVLVSEKISSDDAKKVSLTRK
jgi:hypothetical protein